MMTLTPPPSCVILKRLGAKAWQLSGALMLTLGLLACSEPKPAPIEPPNACAMRCDTPPPASCEGDVALTHGEGVCEAGACAYPQGRQDCASQGERCRAGACVSTLVKAIAAGGQHTCALLPKGSISCWGDNTEGQLGDGTTLTRPMPMPVMGLSDAIGLTAGGQHTCALHQSGTVACWGRNFYGQLGDGTTNDRVVPTLVKGLSDAIALHAGRAHTCALRRGGTVACWGSNSHSQLGDQTNTNRSEPTPVKGLSDAIAVTAGDDHTCALHQTGEVSCWKDNPFGSVGLGRPSGSPPPQRGRELTKVQGLSDIIAIAAGDRHTCAVHQSGEVSCWGSLSGAYTQSDGTTTSRDMPSPVLGLSDVIALDVGGAHTCAVRQGGTVACWGTNSEGQLGDGTTTPRDTSTVVLGLSDASAIMAGSGHTCALRQGNRVTCWGFNGAGQLGDNTMTTRHEPSPVLGL